MSEFKECPTCASKPGAPTLCGECRARRATHYLAADALAALAGAGIATPIEGYSGAPWALKGDIQRLAAERDRAIEAFDTALSELATVRVQAAELQAALRDLNACIAWNDTMQQWVLMGPMRTLPALEQARAALAKPPAMQAGGVVHEVLKERARQDAKWGEQNHPDLSPEFDGAEVGEVHEEMGVLLADDAKAQVERRARRGALGYADIALEEFAEAIEAAALRDTKALRTELIQTAAVLVAWVECIDRRTAKAEGCS